MFRKLIGYSGFEKTPRLHWGFLEDREEIEVGEGVSDYVG